MNLCPSVTTIIRCAAAPGLESWKQRQVLLAALTLPRINGECDDDFCVRIMRDSQQQTRDAADCGTAIHAAIERHYRGEMPEAEYWPHVKVARGEIAVRCGEQEWRPERSFAHPLGYGGKCDLHSTEWLIDYKSKENAAAIPTRLYDEQIMQLAAYRRALAPSARCGILFVSADDVQARLLEAERDELVAGLMMFDALLAFWQAKNGYRPSFDKAAA